MFGKMPAVCNLILDALVIGNGPAGMSIVGELTGKVSGRYEKGTHPVKEFDALMASRINEAGSNLLRDLRTDDFVMSDYAHYPTRSKNPMSQYFDYINHPFADIGGTASMTCLRYTDTPTNLRVMAIGSGTHGGSWATMPRDMPAASPGHWMRLPGSAYQKWYDHPRPPRGQIADTYKHYPEMMGIADNFLNEKVVKASFTAKGFDLDGEQASYWEVETDSGKALRATNLILANGMYDVPRKLNVPGEELSHVTYREVGELESGSTIVVVGAGLSAADFIATVDESVTIHHIFRTSAKDTLIGEKFSTPSDIYSEYFSLWQLMSGRVKRDTYRPHPSSVVSSITENSVVIKDSKGGGEEEVISTDAGSRVFIMIGSVPDFSFFDADTQQALQNASSIVDRKYYLPHDAWTSKIKVPGLQSVYAAGPIRGDNFVRFFLGDAIAITKDILKQNKQHPS
eukprot:TRINITY_DN8933_c0_g1_i1.p1 TRINITY_DN8933_c0_g1~~TRINITY_DN8933_c0_g1_i1.p1  ORF type:complete len:456 (+),score=88.71 TRINITY_DN8933_c0_g1_i1:107-1474(+)